MRNRELIFKNFGTRARSRTSSKNDGCAHAQIFFFAWNCNKQNKGSVREFHMLDNYSASDRFDFNFTSNMLDVVGFG